MSGWLWDTFALIGMVFVVGTSAFIALVIAAASEWRKSDDDRK